MRHKSLMVLSITLIAGLFTNQQTKGCDDSKEYIKGILSIPLISSLSEIIIDKQEIDQRFIDSWIEVESSQETVSFDKIKILTIKDCRLSKTVSYDIFNGFVNLQELKILRCNIDSKCLNNLLRGINPCSISKLDLSKSSFEYFFENDLTSINGLFCLSELVLPVNIDKDYVVKLEKLFGYPKVIIDDFRELSKDEIINEIDKREREICYLQTLLSKIILSSGHSPCRYSQINPQIITDDQKIRIHIKENE